jgi:hypothetical protein
MHRNLGRLYIRRATFCRLRHDGLIAKAREALAFGLTYTEYELTGDGRAALYTA